MNLHQAQSMILNSKIMLLGFLEVYVNVLVSILPIIW